MSEQHLRSSKEPPKLSPELYVYFAFITLFLLSCKFTEAAKPLPTETIDVAAPATETSLPTPSLSPSDMDLPNPTPDVPAPHESGHLELTTENLFSGITISVNPVKLENLTEFIRLNLDDIQSIHVAVHPSNDVAPSDPDNYLSIGEAENESITVDLAGKAFFNEALDFALDFPAITPQDYLSWYMSLMVIDEIIVEQHKNEKMTRDDAINAESTIYDLFRFDPGEYNFIEVIHADFPPIPTPIPTPDGQSRG